MPTSAGELIGDPAAVVPLVNPLDCSNLRLLTQRAAIPVLQRACLPIAGGDADILILTEG